MENRKFYNFTGITKVGEVVVATLEGNVSKDLEVVTVKVKGEDKKVGKFNLAVNGNLQSRVDYILKKEKQDSYPDATFVQVVGWDKVAETFEKVVQKGRRMEVFGILVEKSYEGKNGIVHYIELTVQDKQNFRGFGKKNSDGGTNGGSGNIDSPTPPEDITPDDGDIPF